MPHRLATLALSTSALLAQGDYDLDKRTPGTLGSPLVVEVRGAPGNTFGIAMLAFTGGPTPLSLFIPGETRSLAVGTELASNWYAFGIAANGTATLQLGIPANPAYADLRLWWQTLTLSPFGPAIDQISNPVRTQTGVAGTSLLAPASLQFARAFAAGFFDRDDDGGAGNLVVAGGGGGSLTAATGLDSSEVWNFRTMTVTAGATMGTARALHLAVPLQNGKVLLVGGADDTGTVLASCELYDPATNGYAPTGSMSTARVLHAACRLADGRVMVAGGTSSLVDTTAAITNTLNTTQFYDPNTGTWSNGPNLGGRRLAPALTLLSNNQVMVSGGVEVGLFLGIPVSAVSTTAVQRWNPATNAWTNGPAMPVGRAGHQYNQVTLADGRVLLTGGTFVPNLLGAANATPVAAADVYNPTTNSWQSTTMASPRALHTATRLPNGDVLVCGGAQGTLTAPSSIDGVELFSASGNGWTTLPNLTSPRSGHVAAALPDGTVVLVGGQGAAATLTSVETVRL
jgi:hypothetical protein